MQISLLSIKIVCILKLHPKTTLKNRIQKTKLYGVTQYLLEISIAVKKINPIELKKRTPIASLIHCGSCISL